MCRELSGSVKALVLLFVLVALFVSYSYGANICTTDCKEVNVTAYYNTTTTPATKTCWQYRLGEISCWICGTNSPGGGYCLNGNSAKVCNEKTAIEYQTGTCLLICDNMEATDNNFQEAIQFFDGNGVWVQETQYKCEDKSSK